MAPVAPFADRHGWRLYGAGAFLETLSALEAEVERLAAANPAGVAATPKAELLARIRMLIADEIPRAPNAPAYAPGNTLGPAHRHWRRAKFLQRFRLFYRFDSASRIIIYAWVNDETALRKAGARSDPYAVFARRLDASDPPDDWTDLLAQARGGEAPRT
ncbi:type II toxin-antitoxin system YhaV family toxin [Methylobacterium oryzihabitans]|uniref:Toxin YhaV n=1 Tax=Methylobacterium oryzihabitans TaxID=2499852 RepID=A0A3S2XLK9_9HYPH|nr:type II toxin-antitoxin system YhaV family toxin [Methylobacterium oryzihabitans]RVU17795.1 toxin YhaV [Methylobacterium oryzihabitans]